MHHDELLLSVATLRVRVQLGRSAVRRPSGVRDADMVGDRLVQAQVVTRPDLILEHLHLARSSNDLDTLVHAIVTDACSC